MISGPSSGVGRFEKCREYGDSGGDVGALLYVEYADVVNCVGF